VKAYLDANLKDRINEVLKDRFREQSVVETELSAKVAERVSTWAKLFGVYVGLPLLAASAYLAWVGIDVDKSLIALHDRMDKAMTEGDNVEKLVKTIKQNAEILAKQGGELNQKIEDKTQLLAEIPTLAKSVNQLSDRVGVGAASLLKDFNQNGQAIGIDTNHDGMPLDIAKLKAAQISFVFLKATEGRISKDPAFLAGCQALHNAGIACGAYHFFHGGNAEEQAKFFLEVIKNAPVDLPPVLDFEPAVSGKDPSLDDLKVFAAAVEREYGCLPLVYGGSLLRSVAAKADTSLTRYPLWLASFSPTPRAIPPWKDWTFWQFADRLPLDGLTKYSVSVFNGKPAELKEFASKACPSKKR